MITSRHPASFLLLTLVFLAVGSGSALAERGIESIQTSTTFVRFDEQPKQLTVNVTLSADPVLPATAKLVRYNDDGSLLAVLSNLYDDGTHGDKTAGDHVYSGTLSINEAQPTVILWGVEIGYADQPTIVTKKAPAILVQNAQTNCMDSIATLAAKLSAAELTQAAGMFLEMPLIRTSLKASKTGTAQILPQTFRMLKS